jgi:transposase-like protein
MRGGRSTRAGRWRGGAGRCRFAARSSSAFSGHGFPDDVIAPAVRYDLRCRLSHADVVEWLAERGVAVDRATVDRRVRRFRSLSSETARPHRQAVGMRWRVDETYGRLHGAWVCRYRAIDQEGQVVDAPAASGATPPRPGLASSARSGRPT